MVESLKKYAWHKLLLGVVAAVAGLATVILAIVKLADESTAGPARALQIILGIILIVVGALAVVTSLVAGEEKEQGSTLVAGAIACGFGAFVFTDAGEAVLNIAVCYLWPILVASVGGAFVLKAIVDLCLKKPTTPAVVLMVVGACMLALGIVFAVFASDWAGKVSWLLLGLSVLASGAFEIVRWAKFYKSVK